MAPDIWDIRVDDIVEFEDGTLAAVLAPSDDGRWIPVRYIGGGIEEWLDGQCDLAHVDEIVRIVPSHLN